MKSRGFLLAALALSVALGLVLYFFLGPSVSSQKIAELVCLQDRECPDGFECCEKRCAPSGTCQPNKPTAVRPPKSSGKKRPLEKQQPVTTFVKKQLEGASRDERAHRRQARNATTCKEQNDCPTTLTTCDKATGSCQEPSICISDFDCLGERVCHGGKCTDEVEGCRQQDCLPKGFCNTKYNECEAYHCQKDADCAGPNRCYTTTQICVECLDNSDCGTGKTCDAGRCRTAGDCMSQGDCEQGQLCNGLPGKCTSPSTCQDDLFEPNPKSKPTPLEAGTHDLKICGENNDWFSFELGKGEGFLVHVKYQTGVGSMELRTYDQDGELARSGDRENSGNITLLVERAQKERNVKLRVKTAATVDVSYTLEFNRITSGFCADDPWEPNDDIEEATALRVGSGFDAKLCDGRDDWYKVDLQRGQKMTAQIDTWRHNVPLVDIYVEGEEKRLLHEGTLLDRKTIEYVSKHDATHYIRVYPAYLEDESYYSILINRK